MQDVHFKRLTLPIFAFYLLYSMKLIAWLMGIVQYPMEVGIKFNWIILGVMDLLLKNPQKQSRCAFLKILGEMCRCPVGLGMRNYLIQGRNTS